VIVKTVAAAAEDISHFNLVSIYVLVLQA
jgi:hypothetical protein